MIIHYKPDRKIWIADSERSDGPTLKAAGYWWHPFRRDQCTRRNCPMCASGVFGKWWTPDPAGACVLQQYMDDESKPSCATVEPKKEAELVISYNPEQKLWFATAERRHTPLLKEAGWKWEPFEGSERPCTRKNCPAEAAGIQGKWWTQDRTQACRLSQYADAAAAPTCQAQKEAIAASMASEVAPGTIEIPAPPGLAYRPYQLAGISYALAPDRRGTLNADDPGLGKTIQTMGIVNGDTTIRKVLVICPATLRINWGREATKWSVRPIRVTVIDVDKQVVTDRPNAEVDMTIVNYDRLLDITGENIKKKLAAAKKQQGIIEKGPHSLVLTEKSPTEARKKIKVTYTTTHADWAKVLAKETARVAKEIPELEGELREHQSVLDELMAQDWDFLAIDEAQAVKNPEAQRTIAVFGADRVEALRKVANLEDDLSKLDQKSDDWRRQTMKAELAKLKADLEENPPVAGLITKARRVLALTGTPVDNRPVEIWPIVHALDPVEYPSFFPFAKRYCGAVKTKFGWDFSGNSNLGEMREKLRSTIMVRRKKEDVLSELPPKQHELVVLPADTAELRAALKKERSLEYLADETAEAEAEMILAKATNDDAAYKAAVAKLEAVGIAFEHASSDRQAVALARLEMCTAYIDDLLEKKPGSKVVVFAIHHAVLKALQEHWGNRSVILYGETKMLDRQAAVDRFQTDPTCQVFVAGIRAAGVGLTLTAAADEVFVELDWAPGKMVQAEDRCHRIGQLLKVHVRYLVVDGSIDATMAQMLVEKQAVVDAALDTPTDISLTVPPAPTLDPDAPVPTFGPPRTASVHVGGMLVPGGEAYDSEGRRITSGKVGAAPPENVAPVSDEMKALAMKAMQIVAGYCDGARKKDEMGFSACDAKLGKKLSFMPEYTDRVAHLAIRLARKYRGQLPPNLIEQLGVGEGMKPARVKTVDETGPSAPDAAPAAQVELPMPQVDDLSKKQLESDKKLPAKVVKEIVQDALENTQPPPAVEAPMPPVAVSEPSPEPTVAPEPVVTDWLVDDAVSKSLSSVRRELEAKGAVPGTTDYDAQVRDVAGWIAAHHVPMTPPSEPNRQRLAVVVDRIVEQIKAESGAEAPAPALPPVDLTTLSTEALDDRRAAIARRLAEIAAKRAALGSRS